MAGETAALHVEIERLTAERDALRAELTAQQSTLCLQAVCRYISDVLAGDASSSEKHIARTIMHLLPLEQAVPIQQADAKTDKPAAVRNPFAARCFNLGAICARLGFTVSDHFVGDVLGIQPAATDKRASLYTERQFGLICERIAVHVRTLAATHKQAAA